MTDDETYLDAARAYCDPRCDTLRTVRVVAADRAFRAAIDKGREGLLAEVERLTRANADLGESIGARAILDAHEERDAIDAELAEARAEMRNMAGEILRTHERLAEANRERDRRVADHRAAELAMRDQRDDAWARLAATAEAGDGARAAQGDGPPCGALRPSGIRYGCLLPVGHAGDIHRHGDYTWPADGARAKTDGGEWTKTYGWRFKDGSPGSMDGLPIRPESPTGRVIATEQDHWHGPGRDCPAEPVTDDGSATHA